VLTTNPIADKEEKMSEGMQEPMDDEMAGSNQMDETTEPMGDDMDSMDGARNKRTSDPMKPDQDHAMDMDEEMKKPMTHDMDTP
jgi:hypothetical protein